MNLASKLFTIRKLSNLVVNEIKPENLSKTLGVRGIQTSARTKTMPRGALIVLEGCDRSGKSTQSKLLVESLKNLQYKAELLRFPDRTTQIGSLLSSYLQMKKDIEDHAVHLLFAANRWELKDKILDLLRKETTIIVDRYSYSGIAYSATKKGMDIDWCKLPETGLPSPDLVIYLKLDSEIASQRGGFGAERYEDLKIQDKIHRNYCSLQDKNWKFVDANTSVEELQKNLLTLCVNKIAEVRQLPIKFLWE